MPSHDATFRAQRIRDPVHDLIEFHDDEFEHVMWKVIQTAPFQRLRRIKQMGFSEFVFPGATHTRFAHSIGVFHTARTLMSIVRRHLTDGRRYYESRAHCALAAALVHDLGHGPYSHAFEEFGKSKKLKSAHHESMSLAIIRDSEVAQALSELGSGYAVDVANMIDTEATKSIYSAVVSSQFDADRLDYIRRDSLMTGTRHAKIDFNWLIANIEVGEVQTGVDERRLDPVKTFVLGPKALYAAEAFIVGLFQLYPTVYFHKTTRGIEKLFSQYLDRTYDLVSDSSVEKTGLPPNHPLVAYCKQPASVANLLRLDDIAIAQAFAFGEDATDPFIRDVSSRIRHRKLFKAIDIRVRVESEFLHGKSGPPDNTRIKLACERISAAIEEQASALKRPFKPVLTDRGSRSPYKRVQ
jgi:uncharacterized protein